MNPKRNDFIYTNDLALRADGCAEIVKYVNNNIEVFEKLVAVQDDEGRKKSEQDDFWFYASTNNEFPQNYWLILREVIQTELYKYTENFPIILDKLVLSSPYIKYHIVKQGGGYHVFHQEWSPSSIPLSTSILTWHLSLTTHDNEGELEFLYLNKQIEPKAGRMIMFPSYFTHLHRGNPIRSENIPKHYITGWWFASHKDV